MMLINDMTKINELAKKIRRSIIETGYAAGKKGAHFGGALSAVEILACLYGGVMDIDPKHPNRENRDIFIMSKGHAVLALYTSLAHVGYFPIGDLETFEQNDSELVVHPAMNIKRGIEFSGGSLGMGLSQAVGVALAYRRKKTGNRVFILLGDGECQEGAVWEAIMSAAHFKLDNLIVIVDRNRLQCDGDTENVMALQNLSSKFCAFGFDTYEVDGHDVIALCDALSSARNKKDGRPKVVIANTIKGKGVSFMENQSEWHHGVLSRQQYELAVSELSEEVL